MVATTSPATTATTAATPATTTSKSKATKTVIFSAVGAAAGFGACKLFKAKTMVTVIATIGLAVVGGIIGYKQS